MSLAGVASSAAAGAALSLADGGALTSVVMNSAASVSPPALSIAAGALTDARASDMVADAAALASAVCGPICGVITAVAPVALSDFAVEDGCFCGSAAATEAAAGFWVASKRWEKLLGVISPGVTTTRAPIRVQLHSLTAKAIGMRMQPWDAG